MKLVVEKMTYDNILEEDFHSLSTTGRNEIEFKMQGSRGMAVVYAPNGTGKSTISNLLESTETSENRNFEIGFNERTIVPEDNFFHVIHDQMGRNVIKGDTSDYLIGADIRREYELNKVIAEGFLTAYTTFAKRMKKDFEISKISDFLLDFVNNEQIKIYIKMIIPNKHRRTEINQTDFVHFIMQTPHEVIREDLDQEKLEFTISNVGKVLIEKVLLLAENVQCSHEVAIIEQNTDAIKVLRKYSELHTCIVCNNPDIDEERLLGEKENSRRIVYEGLSDELKRIFDEIVRNQDIHERDPFAIHDTVLEFIKTGNYGHLATLKEEMLSYIREVSKMISNAFLDIFSESDMLEIYQEYEALIEAQPVLDEEELMLIKEVVSENIGPDITIERDTANDHNFKLMLGGQAFLSGDVGAETELRLSTGECNFISLAFALLLARHSTQEFIVLDDPISSFDSVYKNKIAYCIAKFLEFKKTIIFTHNIDLVRLLNVQQQNCFFLYMLCNSEGGTNGFTRVNEFEKNILINMHELIKLLRNANRLELEDVIVDTRTYLMAMIPFMRGYAHILCTEDDIYTSLSSIMHGYEMGSVNLTETYKKLFNYEFNENVIVSVEDILNINCEEIRTVNTEELPLLAETLKQTVIYYHLRMKVEKVLTNLFPDTHRTNEDTMLGTILLRAFSDGRGGIDVARKREYRVFFTSRKTLLNEFNHFEGNMNIFQPALDIETSALQREVTAIYEKLNELQEEVGV